MKIKQYNLDLPGKIICPFMKKKKVIQQEKKSNKRLVCYLILSPEKEVCNLLFSFFSQSQQCIQPSVQRRQWHPTPVLLPGKSHGPRSPIGCSPWGCQELDTTELLHFHFSLSCIGEGNGNPLQCSCLENPIWGSLVGCRLWGCTESDMTEVTQQQQLK